MRDHEIPEVQFLEEIKALCVLARKRGSARKAKIAIDMEIEIDRRIEEARATHSVAATSPHAEAA